MPKSIEERIVDMRFNNEQFEKKAKQSIDTVDKLKKSLDFSGAAKGISELEKSSRSFSMASLAAGVENISSKFTAMGIVGVTALQNIANAAIHTGTNMVKSLTLDPVMTGFNEYETKMNAITTILTNTRDKGTTLDDVNRTLQELNEYADQTIYNFAEMTRNIGTFTAAGVDLETSAKAIKGIANLAAGSGSSAQQASTAMYQLSQALAAGRVSLQDWNSVVNAGMGGQLFQNALKETAKQMGIIVDESVSFRDSISTAGGQESWLTSDVLIKTLEKFAEDDTLVKAATQVKTVTQLFDTMKESVQSGWAVSWEYIIGDREQAIQLLTGVSDAFNNIVGPSADARNEMLKFWNEFGGRDSLIKSFTNIFRTLGNVIRPIGEAFREVFHPMTGPKLRQLTRAFEVFTVKLAVSNTTIDKLTRIFKGLFSIVDIGANVFTVMGKALLSIASAAAPLVDILLSIGASIGDYFTSANEYLKTSEAFKNVSSGFEALVKPIKDFVEGIKEAIDFTSIFESIIGGISYVMTPVVNAISGLFNSITNSASSIDGGKLAAGLTGFFFNLGDNLADAFSWISKTISDFVSKIDFGQVFTIINSGIFASILLGVKKFIGGLTEAVESGGGFLDRIKDVLDGVRSSLETWQTNIKASTLLKIAGALALLTASMFVLSTIDPQSLAVALGGLTVMFGELVGSMALLSRSMDGKNFKTSGKVVLLLNGMATALLILSVALKNVSEIDVVSMVKGLWGLATMSVILTASATSLSKNSKGLMKVSLGLIAFATAMLILTKSVESLGSMDLASLAKGIGGLGALFLSLGVFLKFVNSDNIGVLKGGGLVLIATSLLIFAQAIQKLGSMDVSSLAKGLGGIAAALLSIVIFSKLVNPTGLISTSAALVLLGASLNIIAAAITSFGSLSISQLGVGLGGMAGSLLIIAGALRLIPSNILATSVGLVAVGSALLLIAKAVSNFGSMSWAEIGAGLAALAGSMIILSIALYAMNGSIAGAGALLVVSAALAILVPQIKALGEMSWGSILKSLLSLTLVFGLLGGAAALLTPIIPSMLALGGAMAAIGAGMLLIGTGIIALSTGLAALAVSGLSGAMTLVAIFSSLIGLIPAFFTKLAEGVVSFVATISDNATILVTSITDLVRALLNAIVILVPEFVNAGLYIILALLQGIATNIGPIVEAGISIVVNLINGIANKIPDIIDSAFNLVLSFINGLADAIDTYNEPLRNAIWKLILAIKDAFLGFAEDLWESLKDIGKYVIEGLIDGFWSGVEAVGNAVTEIGSNIINGFKDVLGINSPSKEAYAIARFVDKGLINGLVSMQSDVSKASAKVGSSMLDSVKSAVANMADIVSSDVDMQPTIRPVIDLSGVQNGSKQIGKIFASIGGVSFKANAAAAAKAASTFQNGSGNAETSEKSGGNTYQFTQNNYSPKSLSRIDIYRQTKNQFAMLKGLT